MYERFKITCFFFFVQYFAKNLVLPKRQHLRVTIVNSLNTTSQIKIDLMSSDMHSCNLLKIYDDWLVYSVHELECSSELEDFKEN